MREEEGHVCACNLTSCGKWKEKLGSEQFNRPGSDAHDCDQSPTDELEVMELQCVGRMD